MGNCMIMLFVLFLRHNAVAHNSNNLYYWKIDLIFPDVLNIDLAYYLGVVSLLRMHTKEILPPCVTLRHVWPTPLRMRDVIKKWDFWPKFLKNFFFKIQNFLLPSNCIYFGCGAPDCLKIKFFLILGCGTSRMIKRFPPQLWKPFC